MKLYRVILRGMRSTVGGPAYGESYVVADDPAAAYQKVRSFLDKNDIGFTRGREMDRIELLADEDEDGDCGYMLFK